MLPRGREGRNVPQLPQCVVNSVGSGRFLGFCERKTLCGRQGCMVRVPKLVVTGRAMVLLGMTVIVRGTVSREPHLSAKDHLLHVLVRLLGVREVLYGALELLHLQKEAADCLLLCEELLVENLELCPRLLDLLVIGLQLPLLLDFVGSVCLFH